MKYFIVCMQKLKITVTFKVLHTLTSLALQVHLLFPYTSTHFQQGQAYNSPSNLLVLYVKPVFKRSCQPHPPFHLFPIQVLPDFKVQMLHDF